MQEKVVWAFELVHREIIKAVDKYLKETGKFQRMVFSHPLNYVENAKIFWKDRSSGTDGPKFRFFFEELETSKDSIIQSIYCSHQELNDAKREEIRKKILELDLPSELP